MDGVHRIVAADIDKVTDLPLQQRLHNLSQLLLIGVVQFHPAGAQRRRRRVAEQLQPFRRCQLLGQVDVIAVDHSLDSIARAIDSANLAAGHAAFNHARYGGVDSCGRAARLCD